MPMSPHLVTGMTPFPHHVDAAQDLWTARALMDQYGIRHLPVMRDGELAGIITHRDIDVSIAVAGDHASEVGIPVWSVCHRDAYVVDIHTSVAEVADTMANQQIGSALVTKDGRHAGIVPTVDLCRALASVLRGRTGSAAKPACGQGPNTQVSPPMCETTWRRTESYVVAAQQVAPGPAPLCCVHPVPSNSQVSPTRSMFSPPPCMTRRSRKLSYAHRADCRVDHAPVASISVHAPSQTQVSL